MTVNTATSTATYTGNGTTIAFPVSFYFLVNTDLQVLQKVAATGVVKTLVLNSDYTLTGAGVGSGGTLTMTTAPAAGDTLYIARNVSAVQQTAYPTNSPFPAASHEMALDRLTMLAQQLQTAGALALQRSPLTATYDLGNNTLINENTAVNAADVPNLLQVQTIAAGAAGGVLPGSIALTANLAGTGAGQGASGIGFLQAGTGAVARTVQDELRDRVSVCDFMTSAQIVGVRAGAGTPDVTAAFQAALNHAATALTAIIIPPGSYLITATLNWSGTNGLTVIGYGDASVIVHGFDGQLFNSTSTAPTYIDISGLRIVSSTVKSAGSVAFYFGTGLSQSRFRNIRYSNDGATAHNPYGFFDCLNTSTIDTVEFVDAYLNNITGQGYGIAKGSSIWWIGGRTIGNGAANPGVGVKFYGGSGGVFMWGHDWIQLSTGIALSAVNGTSNREVFLSQSAVDGCAIGLDATDASYINIEGIWAASCTVACVNLEGTFTGVLNVAGGTIFNGGVAGGAGDGIVINSASRVYLNGLRISQNLGTAVRCPGVGQPGYASMIGCQLEGNGTALSAQGTWLLSNNYFNANTTTLVPGSATLYQYNNIGLTDTIRAQQANVVPTLLNLWVNEGGSNQTAGYYKDNFGVVHLQGILSTGTVGAAMFVLPLGYRPTLDEIYTVPSNGAYGQLIVQQSTGNVTLQVGSNVYASLSGINFRAA